MNSVGKWAWPEFLKWLEGVRFRIMLSRKMIDVGKQKRVFCELVKGRK